MCKLQVCFVSFIFLQICSGSVFADNSSRGRLPDGRAFRTDAQGVQLVDYIAELELGIEELNRKISGLENEIEERDNLIDGLRRSGCETSGLAERDLLNDSMDIYSQKQEKPKTDQALLPCDPSNCPVVEKECPPIRRVVDMTACPVPDCEKVSTAADQKIKQASLKIEESDRKLQESDQKLRMEREHFQNTKRQLEEDRQALLQEISLLKANIAQKDEELKIQDQTLQNRGADLQIKYRELQSNNRELRTKNRELQAKNRELQNTSEDQGTRSKEIAVLKENLELAKEKIQLASAAKLKLQKELELAKTASARTAAQQEKDTYSYGEYTKLHAGQPKASLSTSRMRSVKVVRATVQSEFNQLRSRIITRNNKYKNYISKNRRVAFRMSDLKSSTRGYPLSVIKMRIKKSTSVSELSLLQRDLREIKDKVNNDITLIERMGRSR